MIVVLFWQLNALLKLSWAELALRDSFALNIHMMYKLSSFEDVTIVFAHATLVAVDFGLPTLRCNVFLKLASKNGLSTALGACDWGAGTVC